MYNFCCVFLYVCQMINFESLDVGSSFVHIQYISSSVYLEGVQVRFIYEGHPVTVKVTGAKKLKIPLAGGQP